MKDLINSIFHPTKTKKEKDEGHSGVTDGISSAVSKGQSGFIDGISSLFS